MKWMIASDHATYYYKEDGGRPLSGRADRLLMLGDLLYRPRNDLPQGLRAERGHPDAERPEKQTLLRPGNCGAEVDQMVLDLPVMADYCITPAGESSLCHHGHIYNGKNPPKGDILIHGHTHVPAWTVRAEERLPLRLRASRGKQSPTAI